MIDKKEPKPTYTIVLPVIGIAGTIFTLLVTRNLDIFVFMMFGCCIGLSAVGAMIDYSILIRYDEKLAKQAGEGK